MDDVSVLQLLVEGQSRLETKVDQLISEKACRKDVTHIMDRLIGLERSGAATSARREERLLSEKRANERALTHHNKMIATASGLSLIVSFLLNVPHLW